MEPFFAEAKTYGGKIFDVGDIKWGLDFSCAGWLCICCRWVSGIFLLFFLPMIVLHATSGEEGRTLKALIFWNFTPRLSLGVPPGNAVNAYVESGTWILQED